MTIAALFLKHSPSAGAEVNSANSRGWTPLMTVAELSLPRLIKLMLPYADLDQTDKKEKTTLH